MDYGALSILPPLLAIILAIATKRVITSLGIGIYAGGLIKASGNPISAAAISIDWIIKGISSMMHLKLVLFIFTMGGLTGLMYGSGAHIKVAQIFKKKIRNKKDVEAAEALYGTTLFIDPIINTTFVGETLREVSDKLGVSKEKFSYILDSTAAPITRIIPFSTWGAYIVGTIGGITAVNQSPFKIYLEAIPLAFYCIFSLILVWVFIFTRKSYGPMKKAEKRAKETGKIMATDADPMFKTEEIIDKVSEAPSKAINFILPITTVIITTILSMLYTGGFFNGGKGIGEAILFSNFSGSLIYGASLGIVVICSLFMLEGWFDLKKYEEMFKDGTQLFVTPMIIIVFAWGIVEMNASLGTATYIVNQVTGIGITYLLPLVLFLATMFVAFSTGTSFGTMGIVLPVALPIAIQMNQSLPLYLASVLAGSTFGDHSSPISDTTILSSSFSGADHIDHVNSQLPYAFTAAGASAVSFLLLGLDTPYIVSLSIGLVALITLVYVLSGIKK